MSSLLQRLCCCCCLGSASHPGSNDAGRAHAGAYSPVGALSPDRHATPAGLNGTAAADQFEIEIDEMEEEADHKFAMDAAASANSKQKQQQQQAAEKEEREDDEEDDNDSAPLQRTVEMQPLAAAGRASPRLGNKGHTPLRNVSPRPLPTATTLAPPPPLVYSFPAPPSATPASSAAVLSTPSSTPVTAATTSRSPDSLVTSSDLERDDTDWDIRRFRQALEEVESKIMLEGTAAVAAPVLTPAKANGSLVPPPARPSPVLLPRSKLIAAAARGTGSASARASNDGPLTFTSAHAANGPPHLSTALPTVRKTSVAAAARSVPSSPAVDVSNLLARSLQHQQQQPLANGTGLHKPSMQPSSIQQSSTLHPAAIQLPHQQSTQPSQLHPPAPLIMPAQHVLHMVHSPSAPALSTIVPAIPDAPVEPASPRTTAQLEKLAQQGAATKQVAELDSMIPEEEITLEATSPVDIPTVAADLNPRPVSSPPRSPARTAAAATAAAATAPATVAVAGSAAPTTAPASAAAAPAAAVVKSAAAAPTAAPAASAVSATPPKAAVAAPASAAPKSTASKKHAAHAHSNPLDRLGVPGGVISSAHMEELMSALKGSPAACADDGALINVDEVSYAHLFAFLAGTPRTLPGKVVKPFVIPELQALIAGHTQAAQHAAGRKGNGAGAGHGGHPPLKRSASVSNTTAHSAPHPATGSSSAAAAAGSSAAPAPKVGSALSLEAAKLLLSFMHWLVDIRIDRPVASSSASAAAALSTLTLRFDFGPAASGAYSYIDLPSQPTWVLSSKHPRDPYLVHPLNQPKIYTNESHRLCIHRELCLQFSGSRGVVSIRSGDVSIKKSFVSLNCDLRTEYRPGMVEYDDSRNPFLVMREDDDTKPLITEDGHYLPRTFDCWLVVTVLTRETWVGLPIIGKQAPPDRNMKPHAGYPYP